MQFAILSSEGGGTTANEKKMEKDFPISICLVLEVKGPGLMETER